MRYTKEQRELARTLAEMRVNGDTRSYALIPVDEIMESRNWLAQRDYENQLMQKCIAGMIGGLSPCDWCEEKANCKKKQCGNRGCKGWWLRFLTDEEVQACKDRAEGKKDDQ